MATLADSFLDDLDELGESSEDEQEATTEAVGASRDDGLDEMDDLEVSWVSVRIGQAQRTQGCR